MKLTQNKAFTLVELLVVITILAIISVVAYQNFGGAVDKANAGRKISDISTIESALQQYKVDNNYYPKVDEFDINTNLWGYSTGITAKPSNIVLVDYDGEAISSVSSLSIWGWKVYWSWTLGQIWAKGTISRNTLGKRYLSKDLYDPEVWDIKVWTSNDIMINHWIGRYIYSVYRKSSTWPDNKGGIDYNLAFTVKETGTDTYITKIVWSYDNESCFADASDCPETLIWSTIDISAWVGVLSDKSIQSTSRHSGTTSYWVPYAVNDFKQQ